MSALEVERALTSIVESDLAKAQLDQHASFLTMHMKNHLLKGVDYMAYGISDELELPPLDVASCEAILASHDPKIRETLIGVLKDLFSVRLPVIEPRMTEELELDRRV